MSPTESARHLLVSALLIGCGSSGSSADCDPAPPCEVSGTVEISLAAGAVIGGSYEVALEVGDESVVFECTIDPTAATATCTQTDRVGLEAWLVDLSIVGPTDAPTALALEIDRGEDDDAPGPSAITLQVTWAYGSSTTKIITPNRSTLSQDGQSCERCWYELPESV